MALAQGMTIAAWLQDVGDGLGAHTHILETYGAVTVTALGTLNKDDINAIADMLRSDGKAAPLHIKWITKALASEVVAQAKRTAPPPPPPRTARRHPAPPPDAPEMKMG